MGAGPSTGLNVSIRLVAREGASTIRRTSLNSSLNSESVLEQTLCVGLLEKVSSDFIFLLYSSCLPKEQ